MPGGVLEKYRKSHLEQLKKQEQENEGAIQSKVSFEQDKDIQVGERLWKRRSFYEEYLPEGINVEKTAEMNGKMVPGQQGAKEGYKEKRRLERERKKCRDAASEWYNS